MSALFSDHQHWALCDCNCSDPVPLDEADLSIPFVYDRKYGLFYAPSGYHQITMSTLLAFHHGLVKSVHVMHKLKFSYLSESADYWLEHIPGAAFLSSVNPKIHVATIEGLSVLEKSLFGEVVCCF